MTPDEAMAKLDTYRLSSDEVGRLNAIQKSMIDSVMAEFGPRTHIAMTNTAASGLAHALADPEEAWFIMTTLNEWLAVTASRHGGLSFKLQLLPRPEDAA
jgi:hypothetical protein